VSVPFGFTEVPATTSLESGEKARPCERASGASERSERRELVVGRRESGTSERRELVVGRRE
jgi:hypothetical protein